MENGFFTKLISENNNINEQIVAGYIGLFFALIYLIVGFFKPIEIEILKILFTFVGTCFGITSLERIGSKKKEVSEEQIG